MRFDLEAIGRDPVVDRVIAEWAERAAKQMTDLLLETIRSAPLPTDDEITAIAESLTESHKS